MPLSMPDSVTPGNIPMGYPAVLGYVDGEFATAPRLAELFPKAKVVSLTVTGGTLEADGVDCEPGNVNAKGAAEWVKRKLDSAPASRPVVYADLASPGYSMTEVLAELAALGVARGRVRLLTAHYTGQPHVCEAGTCAGRDPQGNLIAFRADGTQWTDQFAGIGGSKIDMSQLNDDFLGAPADWVFAAVRGLEVTAAGPHSVRLSWSSPGTPAPEAVHHYQVTIRHDGADLPSYPRDVPKGPNPQDDQFGSLPSDAQLEALVRAVAVDGHASMWSVVTFRTPG